MEISILDKIKKTGWTFVSIITIIVVWKIVSSCVSSSLIVPSPENVFKACVSLIVSKNFLLSFLGTLKRVFISLLLSFVLGIIFAFLKSNFKIFNSLFNPVLEIIKSTPFAAIVLLLIFVFPSDFIPSIAAVLMTLPVVTINCEKGFLAFSKRHKFFASVHNISFLHTFFLMQLPSSYPFIFSGIISSSSLIWKVTASAEVLTLPKYALGSIMAREQVLLEMQNVFAVTIILIVAGSLTFVILNLFDLVLKYIYKKAVSVYFKNLKLTHHVPFKNIEFENDIKVLYKNNNLTFKNKKITVLKAPSGWGKTTVLENIAKDFKKNSCVNISYVFQFPYLPEVLTVEQMLLLGLYYSSDKFESYEKTLNELLEMFDIKQIKNSYVSKISGGEGQRVALAFGIMLARPVVLLDEPFTGIDDEVKEKIIVSLKKWFKEKKSSVICVTHSKTEAMLLTDDIIELK